MNDIKVLFLKGKVAIAPNEFSKDVEIELFQQFYNSFPDDSYLKGYFKGLVGEVESNIRDDFWYVPVEIIAQLTERLELALKDVEILKVRNREILEDSDKSIENLRGFNAKLENDVHELQQRLEVENKRVAALMLENEKITLRAESQKASSDHEIMCLKAKLYDLTQLADKCTQNLREVM